MADIEYFKHEDKPVPHEMRVILEIGQGTDTLSISGWGLNKEDAIKNAFVALNKFSGRADIEEVTARVLLEEFEEDFESEESEVVNNSD